MKPGKFDYVRPDSVDEALALLDEHQDDASVIAGGQSLMAMLNLRLAQPRVLIDISRLEELSFCGETDGCLEVGATVTQAALLDHAGLDRIVPLLARAMPWIGHYQTRNRGTVCGSLAHADPSAELPLCLAALEGVVVLRSTRGERILSAAEFQTGVLSTAREPDELIVAARFPVRKSGAGYAFVEISRRRGDFAIVALAGVAQDGALRLAVAGVADRPAVRDLPLAPDQIDDALNAFAWELRGEDDLHATARYRRDMVRRLGRKVLEEARTCSS